MTDPIPLKRFTHPRAWTGDGSHSLALCFSDPSPSRLRAARDALWSYPGLEGPWRRNDREPTAASRIASTWGLDHDKVLYGLAHLPGTTGVAVAGSAVVDDHLADHDCPLCREVARHAGPPVGWLQLDLPFDGLGLHFPTGRYPVADGTSLAWRDEVDGWLRGLAEHVHREVPFAYAALGWMDGAHVARRPEELPERRSVGQLFPEGDGLGWYPPTEGAPFDEDPFDLAPALREELDRAG
jgi:hypothetical protein